MAKTLDPRRARARRTFPLTISDGEITLRRCDVLNLVLTGKFEPQLLQAAQRMEDVYAKVGAGEITSADAIAQLQGDEKGAMLQALRQYACIAVVTPIVTMEDDGNPDHLPVEAIPTADLLRIWNATPPADVAVDPQQPVAVPEGAAVEEFRGSPAESAAADAPVADGDSSAPRLENVAVQTIESPDGGLVEFAHL